MLQKILLNRYSFMNKPPPPDKEDLEFFKEAMSGVKPTKSFPAKVKSKKNIFEAEKTKLINLKDDKQQISPSLFDPTELTIGAEDRLFFSRPGLQNKRIKQFIRGEIRQSDYLDLHQMTVEQARSAALLDAARAKGPEELAHWEELYKPTPLIASLNGVIIARSIEPGGDHAVHRHPHRPVWPAASSEASPA